jgi:hypothetical protein
MFVADFITMAATTTQPSRSDLFPFELVRPELERVEVSIREQVRGFDPAVEPYVAYICNTSGKRIRPALAILIGGASGGVTDDHLKIGVILELIHMATLVHDDIMDGAKTPSPSYLATPFSHMLSLSPLISTASISVARSATPHAKSAKVKSSKPNAASTLPSPRPNISASSK